MLILESEVISLLNFPSILTIEDQKVTTFVFSSGGLWRVVSLEPNVIFLVESPFSGLEFFSGQVLLIVVLN